jgi:hemoglobin
MGLKSVCAFLLFLLFGTLTVPAAAQPPAAPPPPPNPPMTSPPMGPSPKATMRDGKTLYQRIGGYDAIAKTVDAFLPNLIAALPKLGTMATGLSDASKVRNRQMIVDQICMLTGGPCIFVGRPNDVTHQGLQITQEDWDKSQGALAKTLDQMGVKDPDKSELIAVIDSLKGDIIQKPAPAGRGRSGQ